MSFPSLAAYRELFMTIQAKSGNYSTLALLECEGKKAPKRSGVGPEGRVGTCTRSKRQLLSVHLEIRVGKYPVCQRRGLHLVFS